MTEEEKGAIRRVVANVATNGINKKKDKTAAETKQFLQNRIDFLFWLSRKLGERANDFLSRIGTPSDGNNLYIFSYAIENPDHFARVMIEILEGGELEGAR